MFKFKNRAQWSFERLNSWIGENRRLVLRLKLLLTTPCRMQGLMAYAKPIRNSLLPLRRAKGMCGRRLCLSWAHHRVGSLLLSPSSSCYRSLPRLYVYIVSRSKKHIFSFNHDLHCGRTMGVWDNLRTDLRLRNLSVLSPLERITHGCQLTKISYIRTMVLTTLYAMLHEWLTHIRASILAAMLLYLLAIPELLVYFSLLSSNRDMYLKQFLLNTVYVGAMNL